ncbi:MAG: ABC transporter permease [Oscillospiraceae bacterium]
MKQTVMKLKENRWLQTVLPIACLALIIVIFGVATKGRFVTGTNINLIIDQALIVAVVATGASYIFATGNINIAMGSCTALTAAICAMAFEKTESVAVMVIVAVAMGIAIMGICALLSTVLRVSVIHVTIVMMVLLTALQEEVLDGGTVSLPYSLTSSMQNLHIPYIIFGVFVLGCIIAFHFTSVGRCLKAVGSNQKCAGLTGIFWNKYVLIAFLVAGLGAGLGALLTMIRSGSVGVTTCASMNMDVMLAIVLGGMPISGGSKSRAYAAVIGAVTVTALNNGLLMVGVNPTLIQGVRGVIFLLLVLAGSKRSQLLPAREG